MVMGSWFGDAFAATQDDGLTDEERRQFQLAPPPPPEPPAGPAAGGFFGQQFAQPAPPPEVPLNPNQGGFRDPVYNPPNITPGDQYAPNPDMGVFTPFHPLNEALFNPDNGVLTPYVEPARNLAGDVGAGLLSPIDTLISPFSPGGPGGPTPASEPGLFSDIGRTLGEGLVPNSIEEIGANFIGAKGPLEGLTGLPLDDLFRSGGRAATDVVRGALPEPTLFPGLGTGPNAYNYEQWAAKASRQAGTPAEAYWRFGERAAPPPVPEVDPWRASLEAQGINVDAELLKQFPPEVAPPDVYGRTFYDQPGVGEARVGLPVDNTAAEMQQAFDTNRALEGGGSAPIPPSVETGSPSAAAGSPPPSSIDDLIAAATAPPQAAPFPMTVDEAVAEAGRLNLPIDRAALERGTPLTQQLEYDRLAGAIDLDNALRSASSESRAADSVFQQNRELAGAGRKPPSDTPQAKTGGGGGRSTGPMGVVHGIINDLLYGLQFAGDVSSIGRQTAMQTINVFNLPNTIQSLKNTAQSIRSAEAGEAINKALAESPNLNRLGVTPRMADWKAGAENINREAGVSGILNKIVPGYEALNRGVATMINSQRILPVEKALAANPNITPAQASRMMDFSSVATGRGTFGGERLDKIAANVLGPVMTSARFAASWPERAAYLIPVKGFGDPAFQMAVKQHAGFIATGLAVMGIAQQAGLNVDWNRGDVVVGDKHYNLWGGGSQYVKLAHDLATGTKNGKDYPSILEKDAKGEWRGILAEFMRNKTGPVPEATMAALRESGLDKKWGLDKEVNFLRPGFWDEGVTGQNKGFLDRAAQFVTFLYLQDIAKAVFKEADKGGSPLDMAVSGASMGVPSVLGVGAQQYDERTTNPLSQMRNEALGSVKYADLLPKEQQALNEALQKKDPEGYAKALAESQSRQDPAIRANQEARDAVREEKNSQIAPIVGGVVNGTYTPGAAYGAIKEIQEAAAQKTNALLKDPAYLNATKDFTNDSVARRALDTYYAIPNSAKGPDGKVDWTRADQLRAELVASIANTDPGLARRLLRETETTNLYEDLKKLAPKAGVR